VWGSEFTKKAATLQGDSAEFVPSLCVVAFGPVVARARVLVHEVSRAKELAEQQRARSVVHTGLEVKEHRAGHVIAALGFVVKRVGAVELHVVAAAVLAVAADTVLVAHHLPKLVANLATALARLHVKNLARSLV
jgi:hypothetical protein